MAHEHQGRSLGDKSYLTRQTLISNKHSEIKLTNDKNEDKQNDAIFHKY